MRSFAHHASCAGADAQGLNDATGYDSDDDRCPCTYHPVAIEERASHYHACHAWPGPICGECLLGGELRVRLCL